jgi:hypothetical protein
MWHSGATRQKGCNMVEFKRTMTDDELSAALMQATRMEIFDAVAEQRLTLFRVENLLGRGTFAVWNDWYNNGDLPGDEPFAKSINLPAESQPAPPSETERLLSKLVDGQHETNRLLKDILSELKKRK